MLSSHKYFEPILISISILIILTCKSTTDEKKDLLNHKAAADTEPETKGTKTKGAGGDSLGAVEDLKDDADGANVQVRVYCLHFEFIEFHVVVLMLVQLMKDGDVAETKFETEGTKTKGAPDHSFDAVEDLKDGANDANVQVHACCLHF